VATVISIENVSKEYRLGIINNGRLYKDVQSLWAKWRGKEDPWTKIGQESKNFRRDRFWALKDVSLKIERGERIGIIGRNGAGKSTLLKILSRITAPTEGCIKIKGSVASLLEIGTGFHPELTGRENVFLNGTILGMKRREIERKFDEIVAFSEIDEFIDTPVKRYSSGMYVRLAFAVAAHLDSDTLVADEVIAVGDTKFQEKCLGKMEDVSKNEGRTVLFVSHNLAAVQQLCNTCALLHHGHLVVKEDNVADAIKRYEQLISA
jgi:lipopolysaccharide transport system ATP-binding protein